MLVNSTSWDLDLTAGFTSKSILKVAGPGIQEECKKRYKRGIKMGDIAITEGHGLNCKHVFHGSLLSYNSKENFQVIIILLKDKYLLNDTLLLIVHFKVDNRVLKCQRKYDNF